MCTLSWWAQSSVRGIVFNRDEQHSRSSALPPKPHLKSGAPACLYPTDPDGGGTWIGVNAFGLILAVLNHYGTPPPPPDRRESRGRLVHRLLESVKTTESCDRALQTIDCSLYGGFTLFAWTLESSTPKAWIWDGTPLQGVNLSHLQNGTFLTTSSVRESECKNYRTSLFQDDNTGYNSSMVDIHQKINEKDLALGPLMWREDAATVSMTELTLTTVPARASMKYYPVSGPPPKLGQPSLSGLDLRSGNPGP